MSARRRSGALNGGIFLQLAFQLGCFRVTPSRDLLVFSLVLAISSGCAGLSLGGRVRALRMADVVNEGDATRRASQRLLMEGLRADAAGADAAAKGKYERALQLDATNPYVYLVFARFEIERRNLEQADAFLERASSLLDGETGSGAAHSPGVEPHLLGMRGVIDGRESPALEEARRMSPSVWGDGHLSAQELL